jgi:hypothetical protein
MFWNRIEIDSSELAVLSERPKSSENSVQRQKKVIPGYEHNGSPVLFYETIARVPFGARIVSE